MTIAPNLEERIGQLTKPNTEDPRFSGEKFAVDPASIELQLPYLQRDLIVIKVSGKLLLDEKERGEELTKREYLVQTMALLSQLGLNVFLIHGGQEQLDRAIEGSNLDEEVVKQAKLKNAEVRYTHPDIMPLVISTSNSLSDSLKQDILKAGGNANAYLSSLFIGRQKTNITATDPKTQISHTFYDNNFGYLPLDRRLRVVQGEGPLGREGRVLRYLQGEIDSKGAAPGHIVIRGFLVNYADPIEIGKHRKIDIHARRYEDPFVLNGDADNVAAAHAFYFADREAVPIVYNGGIKLTRPERVHLIEVARNGGLRSGSDPYDNIVEVVMHESDLRNREIEGGMEGRVRTNLQVARALDIKGTLSRVKTEHIRELLPDLFSNEQAIRAEYGSGFGTTFAPGGLKAYSR